MSYNPPCLKDLVQFGEELKKIYNDPKQDRLTFIALYDQLIKHTMTNNKLRQEDILNILIGAMVYVMADIKLIEYKRYGSPKKSVGYFYSTGSDLYTVIRSKMNINKKNKFGYDERLFYLNEFYKYINEEYTDKDILNLKQNAKLQAHKLSPKWTTKKELCKHIHDLLNNDVLAKNSEDRHNLVHGVPVLNALLKSLGKLESEYSTGSYNPGNPIRLESLNCIKFILESYSISNVSDVSWHVCSGAVLMPLLQIEKEYRFLSPTRSTLFKACLQTLNQSDISKITLDDKIKWLRSLASYLTSLNDNRAKYEWTLKQVVANTKNQKLTTELLDKQIREYQSKIERFLTELGEKKNTPSYTTTIIETGASYAFQQATGQYVIQTAKTLIGTAIFGSAGVFIMTGLGSFIAEGLLSAATAGLFGWVLGKIGDSVGAATAKVVTYPFSATPRGLEEMRMKLKPVDDIAFVRMVNTLLELDSTDDDDKKHIRSLLGLDVGEKLKPLPTSLIHDAEEEKIRNTVMVEGHHARFLDGSEDSSRSDDEPSAIPAPNF